MMRACQHENIAQLFGVFQDAGVGLRNRISVGVQDLRVIALDSASA